MRKAVPGFPHLSVELDSTVYYDNRRTGALREIKPRMDRGIPVIDAEHLDGDIHTIRLEVAMVNAWYDIPIEDVAIVHEDGDPRNCSFDNLRVYAVDQYGVPTRPLWGVMHRGRIRIDKRVRNPVRIVEYGKVYPSAAIAAEVAGTHKSNVTNVLKGRRKSANGLHFEYADPRDVIESAEW